MACISNFQLWLQGNPGSYSKTRDLPIAEHIVKFNHACEKIIEKSSSLLRQKFDICEYNDLCKALMCKILCFNRRRVGETQRFKIEDYQKKQGVEKDTEEYNLLSDKEKELGEQYVRFETRGKCGRPVPVLLTKIQVKHIDEYVLKLRSEANIPPENPFLFASTDGSLNCCKSMRSIAYECGAKYPERLTGT